MPQLYLYIRFSTRKQRDGNSIARQMEFALKFCEREGLDLDRTFSDEGVPSHKGEHRAESRSNAGGLAEFLALCKAGDIPRGSYLLVESFDRLSREHPLDAMELLRVLLKEYGVTLIVMRPDMRCTAATLGQIEGIMLFLESFRSYGESARKSDLSRDNWKRKRDAARARTKIVGARVPSWCRVEGGKIVLVEERAAVVRRIFDLSRKNMGQELIAQRLRREGVLAFNPSGKWSNDYVAKILRSRSVMGEWQPRALQAGRLVPAGDPIPDYYPQAITPEVWADARSKIADRRRRAGRASVKSVNLFTGLVYMGGRPIMYRCRDGVRYYCPVGESNPGVKVEHVERAMLYLISDIRLQMADATQP